MATGLHLAPDMAAEDPPEAPEIRAASRRSRRLGWLASATLHAIVIALLIGLWRSQVPEETPPITVALVPGNGAAGAEGGTGGGADAEPAQAAATGSTSDEAPARPVSEVPEPAAADAATPAPESVLPTPPEPETPPRQSAPAQAAESVAPPPPEPQPPAPSSAPAQEAAPSLPPAPPLPPHKPTPPARTPVVPAAKPLPPPPAAPVAQAPAQAAASPSRLPSAGTPGVGEGAGGTAGRGTGVQGAGRAAVGTGDLSAIGDDYLDRLRRHIRRFMTYPEVAKQQKQQGEGVMTVLLRRDGTVLDVQIARSSGYPMLDQAALKAVRDSSKVPPFPEGFPVAEGKVDLPFAFHLGFLDRVFN